MAVAAVADLPQARLVTVFPPGVPAGSTNEIIVTGTDLDDLSELLFSDPRILATQQPSKPSAFLVTVPREVPPGLMDVRVRGRFGVSNPRAFAVAEGSGPEWILNPTNTTATSALDLPLGMVVNGRIPPHQVLWFRFPAREGQRLIARVPARELDSRLEPGLRIVTASGTELTQARRGFLDFSAPADGWYFLQLRDLTFRGGDEHVFRLVISPGPHLDFALPNVLRAGETNRVTLFGRNLDGGKPSPLSGMDGRPLDQRAVDLLAPTIGDSNGPPVELVDRPAAAVLSGAAFRWRFNGTNGQSNPLLFTLTTHPVVVAEGITDSTPTRLTAIQPPVEFNGLFPRRGGQSGVHFEARKGDVYWVELWAERLGFPCDPIAVIQRERKSRDEKGEVQYADVLELNDSDANWGGTDFNTVTRDPAARFEVPEDGTYRILVRDLFHTGADAPRYPYRMSVRRETPDFVLVAIPLQPVRANDNDRAVHSLSPFLRRGQTELVKVLAFRRDGFAGDIELLATGLTQGVTMDSTRLPAGQNVGFMPLTAGADASGLLQPVIIGRTTVGTNLVERRTMMAVAGAVSDSNEQVVRSRLVRESLVSASDTEWAPVILEVPLGKGFEVSPEGKLLVPLVVIRRGDFNGAFNLKLGGRSELEKMKEVAVAEKATNVTLEINLGEVKLPEGSHRLWLQGQVAGKYRNNPEALTLAEAELKVAEQALTSATAADKAALEERKKRAEERRKTLEERAKPRDVTVRVYSRPFDVRVVPAPKAEAKP